VKALTEACASDHQLRQRLLRYQVYFLSHVSQSAACNGLHTVLQRCARWLLTMRRGASTNDLEITQSLLAATLGVHRPSVTIVLRDLQKRKLIRSGRGTITVLDSAGLESVTCECYRELTYRYERLMK
jgi:CRP-like cAMP-binding protein